VKHGTIVIIKHGHAQHWKIDIPALLLADTDVAPPVIDGDVDAHTAAARVLAWMREHTEWTAAEDFTEAPFMNDTRGGQVLVIKDEPAVPVDPAEEAARQAAEEALGTPGTLGYLRRKLASLEHLPDELPVVLAATSEGNGFKRLGDVGDGDDPEPDEDDFGVPHPDSADEYINGELPPPCLLLWPS
jgi:hypothetical protein